MKITPFLKHDFFLLVQESSKEEFDLHFKNDSFYHNDCQTQINARFFSIVFENSTNQYYVITSLHSDLSTIHHTKKILFRVNYVSQSKGLRNSFYAADVSFGGSHKVDLPKMRIFLPLEDVDLSRPIDVKSHSKLACAGLYSEFNLESPVRGGISNVLFKPEDSKGCKHLAIGILGTKTFATSLEISKTELERFSVGSTESVEPIKPLRSAKSPSFGNVLTGIVAAVVVVIVVIVLVIVFGPGTCLRKKPQPAVEPNPPPPHEDGQVVKYLERDHSPGINISY